MNRYYKRLFTLFCLCLTAVSYAYIYDFKVQMAEDGTAYAHWKSSEPVITGGVAWGNYFADQPVDTLSFRYQQTCPDPVMTTSHKMVIKKNIDVDKYYGFQAYNIDIEKKKREFSLQYPAAYSDLNGKMVQIPMPVRGPRIAFQNKKAIALDVESSIAADISIALYSEGNEIEVINTENTQRASIRFNHLMEDSVYNYQVTMTSLLDPAIKYETGMIPVSTPSSKKTNEFTFSFMSDGRAADDISDLQANNGVAYQSIQQLAINAYQQGSDFMIFGGDLINGYTSDYENAKIQYQTWMESVSPVWKYMPIYPSVGNHDATGPKSAKNAEKSMEALWRDLFVLPLNGPLTKRGVPDYLENTYAFSYGNARFIMLNPYHNASKIGGKSHYNQIDDTQLNWLKSELNTAVEEDYQYIFAIIHTPVFPVGPHYKRCLDKYPEKRDALWAVLDSYNIDMVLCGHEHFYTRMNIDSRIYPDAENSIPQITSGRTGAPYYQLNDKVPYGQYVEKYSPRLNYAKITVSDKGIQLNILDQYNQEIDSAQYAPKKRDPEKLLKLESATVHVTKVIDGDTVKVEEGKNVRLVGIDTPEVAHPWKNPPEPEEPFGNEATELTRGLIEGKEITIEYDVAATDRYGRQLGYLFVEKDGEKIFVQEELVRNGLAYVYTIRPNLFYNARLLKAQQEAYKKKLGIWSENREVSDCYYADYYFYKYHRPDCRSVSHMGLPYRVEYSSVKEALLDGKGPCRNCKP